MLLREARWLAAQLQAVGCDALSPLLDVGSGTSELRTQVQPWIEDVVLGPLRAAGCLIDHLDRSPGPGIDLVVDVTSASAVAGLASRGYRSVLCCNLLEHVPDPAAVGAALARVVVPGGYVVASVPHRFPHHADPIDTMYRPGVSDLAAIFPDTQLVAGAVVPAGRLVGHYLRRLGRTPTRLGRAVGRPRSAGEAATARRTTTDTLRWLLRRLEVTCVVVRRHP